MSQWFTDEKKGTAKMAGEWTEHITIKTLGQLPSHPFLRE